MDDDDDLGINLNIFGENQVHEFEDDYDNKNNDEQEYTQGYKDRERAQMGLHGKIQQETGNAVPLRYKSKRDRALGEIDNVISKNTPFFEIKDDIREEANNIVLKLKDIENYYLPLLYSAAVFVAKRVELDKTSFKTHMRKYDVATSSTDKDNFTAEQIDELTLLRYIRKLQSL